ncbi:DUF943 family protein [Rahnella sp. PD12R]|uniref:DUF943 family protein n=1 Tax=Rahnella sp. PD12R TaxID=2855688 RepID=UPI001C48A3C5|nr:DUF943 family protein [Rahnella sp. PD12R]MBV6818636.1 DUF943 family protein [Rahnella sp. PD12R]
MRKTIVIATILCIAMSAYMLLFRKTEIIFVHHVKGETDIVVRNFPLTQAGKIIWWENNKDSLLLKNDISDVDEYGNYFVGIEDIGVGFVSVSEARFSSWYSFSKNDLICFDEIKSESRCIEKKNLMMINNGRDNKTYYYIDGDSITK